MITLYRRYRPQRFSDVHGQTHVVQVLQGALLSDNIGHAYLFTGPRGTGKTSLARIFAKALNCLKRNKSQIEPCDECTSCIAIRDGRALDLIEIDAASNRGIEDIRELKEATRTTTTSSRYKVFIIDETHMLTTPAFNALLKTLEEPPAHVIFLLATTEVHKLPETILSRVQRLDLKLLTDHQITEKLRTVAQKEKVAIEDGAIEALVKAARGSLRDAESLLATLIAHDGNKITTAAAAAALGLVPAEIHRQFLNALLNKETATALEVISELYENGVSLPQYTRAFIEYLRQEIVQTVQQPNNGQLAGNLAKILETMMRVRIDFTNTPVPQLPLELAVYEITLPKS